MSHSEVFTMRRGKVVKFKIHTWLKDNLDIMVEARRGNLNFNGLTSGDGKTRTGKTTITIQEACYVDHTFLDNWKTRIIYDWDELIEVCNKLKPGQAVIYDEARDVLNSANSMSRYCQKLLTFFSRVGSKNLFIFVVLPDFFDLPKSLAIVQSHFLINVYFRNGFQRGFFNFFNDNQKKYLYIMGKKFLDYNAAKPSFKGTFTNFFPLNYTTYEAHKQEAFKRVEAKKKKRIIESPRVIKYKDQIRVLVKYTMEKENKTQKEMGQMIGVTQKTIGNYLSNVGK